MRFSKLEQIIAKKYDLPIAGEDVSYFYEMAQRKLREILVIGSHFVEGHPEESWDNLWEYTRVVFSQNRDELKRQLLLTVEEITELISPTVDEIRETLNGDVDKLILFMHGACAENYRFKKDTDYLSKALMIEPRLAKDQYVVKIVNDMFSKKKKDAKIGRLKAHGNFCVISGDPFAFCQSNFRCDVPDDEKGLLRAGEIYSKYWIDDSNSEGKRVVCFRAPMSCHNNIRAMNVVCNNEISYWYQYMPTINVINCHDTFYPALNGADNDGDAIFTTDNRVLLDKWRDEPAILCVQKKGQKRVITSENLVRSNKNGFGDGIGSVTNRVTAMYDVMSKFPPNSEQHKTLEYRIRCGQHAQQSQIDKIKGIEVKPILRHHSVFLTQCCYQNQ